MPMLLMIYGFCLLALLLGSYTDIKTREVPDWVNYGLLFLGFGLRTIYTVGQQDVWILLEGIAGFLLFLALAYLMFYTGQWGGGDSKMIMALGAMIGLDIKTFPYLDVSIFPFLLSFLINILFVGAAYGLLWSILLSVIHRESFMKELKKGAVNKKWRLLRYGLILCAIILTLAGYFLLNGFSRLLAMSLGIMIFFTYLIYIYVKAIEASCMIKKVTPDKLTEGDWIVKDVVVEGKRICGPKDLGIEKKQIEELKKLYGKKKIRWVIIKEGIPFVPSFLIGFLVTLYYGNVLFLLF